MSYKYNLAFVNMKLLLACLTFRNISSVKYLAYELQTMRALQPHLERWQLGYCWFLGFFFYYLQVNVNSLLLWPQLLGLFPKSRCAVPSWISETSLTTAVDNVVVFRWISCSTICVSLHKKKVLGICVQRIYLFYSRALRADVIHTVLIKAMTISWLVRFETCML